MDFQLTRRHLERALDRLAEKDRHIALALKQAGYPEERRQGEPSFEHLLRILVGQQLSVKAAASIFGRLEKALGGELQPQRVLDLSDEGLRSLGLSRQKIAYARGLSEAVLAGRLVPAALVDKPDEAVVAEITRLKGFGRWSAEMFLLFSLGRPDVWPADDLAIQAGLQRIKKLGDRPDRRQAHALAEPWRPDRGAAAIFVWHFYANAPVP